jgi:hypothetical protein
MTNLPPDQQIHRIQWDIWFQWVLATTLGWVVGLAIFGEIGIGIAIGIAQWFVLRRLGPQAAWWILASALGWLGGWALIVSGLVVSPGTTGLNSVISGAVLGVAIGVGQWLTLRRLVHEAGWWVFASTAGWTVGLTGVLGALVVGTVVGALTGFMLDWLWRNPRDETLDI